MSVYEIESRTEPSFVQAYRCRPSSIRIHLEPRRDILDHSSVFSVEKHHPGSYQLSLAILADFLDSDKRARGLHYDLAVDMIHPIVLASDSTYQIRSGALKTFLNRAQPSDLQEPIDTF